MFEEDFTGSVVCELGRGRGREEEMLEGGKLMNNKSRHRVLGFRGNNRRQKNIPETPCQRESALKIHTPTELNKTITAEA